jgi:HAD superfamily hydrolase (TIGR01509 family)
MIRNIIFDLGNVLISFYPSEYLKKKNYPESIRNIILRDIFHSEEWRKLDEGTITVGEAIESISLKSSLKREEIALIFNLRIEIMFPLDNNVRLLPALKKRGFSVYFLSNFHLDTFEIVSNDYFFFRYFDGGVISADIKIAKPDKGIYELILTKYGLVPGECLFIDDVEENVVGASAAGMKVLNTHGSENITDLLEKELSEG